MFSDTIMHKSLKIRALAKSHLTHKKIEKQKKKRLLNEVFIQCKRYVMSAG